MDQRDKLELQLTVVGGEGTTLRELEGLRISLHDRLKQGLVGQDYEIYQPPLSRALDPVVVGSISLIILPVIIDKVADLLIKWTEVRNESTVSISIPVDNSPPIVITYNPQHTQPGEIKEWIISAVQTAKGGHDTE